jgi:hypothetical protein
MEWVTEGFSLIFAIHDQIILTKLNFAQSGSDIHKKVIMQLFAREPVFGYYT